MKKKILYSVALALTMTLTGCFDDDSTSATDNIAATTIEGIESSYVKTAYVGEHLVITPDVKASFPEGQLTYTWMLLDSNTGSTDKNGNTIEPTIIGSEKNLDYDVQLSPGIYQLRLAVADKESGYTAYAKTSLTVRTLFSQAFYILKETAEGNTEVDLLTLDGQKGDNLLTQVNGAPLQGKPLTLYPNYDKYYINPDNDEIEGTNAIMVTTDRHNISFFRTSDFKEIFNRDNIMFDAMDANEQPYGTFLTSFGKTVMITSTGIYSAVAKSNYTSPTSGQCGLPLSECGGSKHFFTDPLNYGGGALWDTTSHSLMAFDYNMTASPLLYDDWTGEDETQNLTSFDCLHCGFNCLAGSSVGTFVLADNATGNRYLYLVSSTFFGCSLQSRMPLPRDSHAATATAYSTNGVSASYLYCIDGGKVYAGVMGDDYAESQLKFEGIGSDETIAYVTNQYWNSASDGSKKFDYLVVATQSGANYKLRFYETNGGAPVGQPVHTAEGEGYVKSVRFQNDSFSTFDWYSQNVFSIND